MMTGGNGGNSPPVNMTANAGGAGHIGNAGGRNSPGNAGGGPSYQILNPPGQLQRVQLQTHAQAQLGHGANAVNGIPNRLNNNNIGLAQPAQPSAHHHHHATGHGNGNGQVHGQGRSLHVHFSPSS